MGAILTVWLPLEQSSWVVTDNVMFYLTVHDTIVHSGPLQSTMHSSSHQVLYTVVFSSRCTLVHGPL